MSTETLPRPTAKADGAAIRAVIDALTRAFHNKDPIAIFALYEPGAVVANLAPPLISQDPDGAELRDWLGGWDGPVVLTHRDLAIAVDGALAVCHGLVRVDVHRAGAPIAWWSRVTYALRRGPEGWRIFHEHNSVPFYMDGGLRAAIDLEP